MGASTGRVFVAIAVCLLWLNGCESSTKLGDLFQSKSDTPQNASATEGSSSTQGSSSEQDPASTGSVQPAARDAVPGAGAKRAGKESEDVSLGKKYFNAGNFTLAERHFRRAVELRPRDLDSWVGLAASYDRLRRFELADRAYDQALKIAGPTGEILNNRGYSYMLRGDYRRARETLLEAQTQDPGNSYIKNNLELLEASVRKNKATQ
jgi:tetratricopeptide (TPR) repeat protein